MKRKKNRKPKPTPKPALPESIYFAEGARLELTFNTTGGGVNWADLPDGWRSWVSGGKINKPKPKK